MIAPAGAIGPASEIVHDCFPLAHGCDNSELQQPWRATSSKARGFARRGTTWIASAESCDTVCAPGGFLECGPLVRPFTALPRASNLSSA